MRRASRLVAQRPLRTAVSYASWLGSKIRKAQCETEQRKIALCPISDYRCYHQFSEKLSPVADHAVRVRFL